MLDPLCERCAAFQAFHFGDDKKRSISASQFSRFLPRAVCVGLSVAWWLGISRFICQAPAGLLGLFWSHSEAGHLDSH